MIAWLDNTGMPWVVGLTILGVFGLFSFLAGRWAGETRASSPLTPSERVVLLHELAKHGLAYSLVYGFLAILILPLLKFVDLTDQTTSNIVFLLIGHISTKVEPVTFRYFGSPAGTGSKPSDDDKPPPPIKIP